jgi:hypothetical protein
MPETTKAPAKAAKPAKAPKPAPVEAEPTGRVLESYQIILRPLVTEKECTGARGTISTL